MENQETARDNFIYDFIREDLREGVYNHVQTRFPPEPNAYLHIGHAKAISIDFQAAADFGGVCNLRFDDTNPVKEDAEYVDAIMEDIKWLGFQWEHVFYASDYFPFLHACAIRLIEQGQAFVCDLSADEIRESRGTLTAPGQDSPYRNRSVDENLDLFRRMTAGEFPNGARVLRAKIDMASPNICMRDPVIYRILHASHHRTGDQWCVYPMYDFAHPLSDTKEGVTHSLCSLEYENNRPLYNWFLQALHLPSPSRQIEFARMNLSFALTSKRKCRRLVEEGLVSGWDDPRMATLRGLRRRGYTPSSIRAFCEKIGVAKAYSVIDYALLESCIRDELNQTAPRAMAVLHPLRLVIDNYPEGKTETLPVEVNPNRPEAGTYEALFSREVYIEEDDYAEEPPKGYNRFSSGREVRLKGAYMVVCTGAERDDRGNLIAIHGTYDPETRGGNAPDGRKVRGTIQWVSVPHAVTAEIRLYDRLFTVPNPSGEDSTGKEGDADFTTGLNPDSLVVLSGAKVEAAAVMAAGTPGAAFQFMRHGYFCVDPDSRADHPVFNRTVSLKDSWKK